MSIDKHTSDQAGENHRTIIVGDIHGCADELDDLLVKTNFGAHDTLISVGDVVAKGPKNRTAVRRLRECDALAVRGNHDEHCLRWWRAKRDGQPLPILRPAHEAVVRELEPEDWAWLDALPLYLELPQHNAIVVHAGLVPGVPLGSQNPFAMMNMRAIDEHGLPTKEASDGELWAKCWSGPELVVFGHDAMRGLQRERFAVGLDTGCVYGGALSAYVLPDCAIVSVPARTAYCSVG
ncbi:MAG: metallophosphoesterase [Polyangiales bacterium]